jgi:hypothetical protein
VGRHVNSRGVRGGDHPITKHDESFHSAAGDDFLLSKEVFPPLTGLQSNLKMGRLRKNIAPLDFVLGVQL